MTDNTFPLRINSPEMLTALAFGSIRSHLRTLHKEDLLSTLKAVKLNGFSLILFVDGSTARSEFRFIEKSILEQVQASLRWIGSTLVLKKISFRPWNASSSLPFSVL